MCKTEFKSQTNVTISLSTIQKILKSKFKLRYKRAPSRPINMDNNKRRLLKTLFSYNINQILEKIDVIVNIDGSSFSRTVKQNYSWLKSVPNTALWNQSYSNSVNLLSAITTTGAWFSWIIANKIDSDTIILFVGDLIEYLKRHVQA